MNGPHAVRLSWLTAVVVLALAIPRPSDAQTPACGPADRADLEARLKAVQATIRLLDSRATASAGREPFDVNTFDSGLGESILTTQMAAGGMGAAVPAADFDRYSCEITTVPFLGGSACTLQSLNAQFNVRQEACRQSQTSAGQGNDYWEGRMMSDVVRELRSAYAAEETFITQQMARLTGTARLNPGSAGNPSAQNSPPAPPPVNCENCLQYILEGTRAFPVIGRIRMFSNSVIPFTVGAGNGITGMGTIVTQLDVSGTNCTLPAGFNGAADVLVSGQIDGNVLDAKVEGQRPGALVSIQCTVPGGGRGMAVTMPATDNYSVSQRLQVPGPGVAYSEETIDLGARSLGTMQGTIVLRLYMTGR